MSMSTSAQAMKALTMRRLAARSTKQGRRQGIPSSRTNSRSVATELPRPSPPKAMPDPVEFSAVAKPGVYYERPRVKRDLPVVPSQWRALLAFGLVGVAGWGVFLTYATNQERLSSSVVRQILVNLRQSDVVLSALGDSVRPEPTWYLNGHPWIDGAINTLQGNVDISFRVKGSKGAGTLYFTSIRREKGQPFTILRFKIICDDGTVINLPSASASAS